LRRDSRNANILAAFVSRALREKPADTAKTAQRLGFNDAQNPGMATPDRNLANPGRAIR
jgi:hypothetical protein